MNTPRHAMIDLETMGLKPDAAIVSMGVVIFDPRYGITEAKTYYEEFDWTDQPGRVIDPETKNWWRNQSEEAKAALHGIECLREGLIKLARFLPSDCKVWGNGATFDISKLEDAYDFHDIEIPWKFWNIRDCRTVKDMYESQRGGLGRKLVESTGIEHNALDDARNQAKEITHMWRKLLK